MGNGGGAQVLRNRIIQRRGGVHERNQTPTKPHQIPPAPAGYTPAWFTAACTLR